MKSLRIACLLGLLVGTTLGTSALHAKEIVVIGNRTNNHPVDKALVMKIYTGGVKYWPDNSPVFPIDQAADNPVRTEFYLEVLGKDSSNMKALWTQNIFTGKALPPKVVDLDSEVKKVVAANKQAIGYIDAASVDGTVKVLFPPQNK